MIKIFGGLWLENLVKQDQYFERQLELYRKNLIQGIQLRVGHPSLTPELKPDDLAAVLGHWPGQLMVHIGNESDGVDLGENLDINNVYHSQAGAKSWRDWNKETIDWALAVAAAGREEERLPAVIHLGYGQECDDQTARNKIVDLLKSYSGQQIALENVPPLIDRSLFKKYGQSAAWPGSDSYWGFGATAEDMLSFIEDLGPGWRCLVDFSHLAVSVNQARLRPDKQFNSLASLETAVERFLNLPRWPICHFSGFDDKPVDSHPGFINYQPSRIISEALKQMEIVCLELPLSREAGQAQIEKFKTDYLP